MGSLSAKLHSGGGPRPRSNGSKSGPLRKIVSVEFVGGAPLETYECGHSAIAKRDLMGFTNATRRRCWKCKREQPDPTAFAEWPAWLNLDGWAGRTPQAVVVIGETPQKYRIRTASSDAVKLGGRGRRLSAGESALVPKTAVTARQ